MTRPDRVDWVIAAAAVEVVTGIVLIIRPSLFGWLVFGAGFSPAGQALGRLAGFSLFALALACWPRLGADRVSSIRALLLFSLLSAIYLIYLGVHRGLVGPLLWPAVALHAALTIMLIRGWFVGSQSDRPTGEGKA
jgi:hypothetical protein